MQELTSTEVEHELGEEGELTRELEAARVVLLVLSEPGDQLDQHAIDPAYHIDGFFTLCLEHGLSRHYHS